MRIFASAVCLVFASLLWMGAHPEAAGVAVAAGLGLLAWEIVGRLRARDEGHVLPRELDRLAWRSDESAVAFVWRFRPGRECRVGIMRSQEHYADRSLATDHDQALVFDGQGDQAVDRDVLPRRTYYYSILFDRTPERAGIVRLEIPTLPPDEREAIEATYAASAADVFKAEDMPSGWRMGAYGMLTGRTGPEPAVEQIASVAATDAVYAVAELFASEEPPTGWVEVK